MLSNTRELHKRHELYTTTNVIELQNMTQNEDKQEIKKQDIGKQQKQKIFIYETKSTRGNNNKTNNTR